VKARTRLDVVERLARVDERRARRGLGEAQVAAQESRGSLERAAQAVTEALGLATLAPGQIARSADLVAGARQLGSARVQQAGARTALHKAETRVVDARRGMVAARARLRAVSNAAQRRRLELEREWERRGQRRLDDAALALHGSREERDESA
jgi:flagellar biosynthesis chaperone FliJ